MDRFDPESSTKAARQPNKRVRVGLVGCVSSKAASAVQAQDLYVSTLFQGRRNWVERTCDTWFILSAKYGLVLPTQVIEPYEVSLTDAPIEFKHDWADHVFVQIESLLGELDRYEFEIHAGSAYRDFGLLRRLRASGALVLVPTEGLNIGGQLELYGLSTNHERSRSEAMSIHPSHTRQRSSYQEIGRRLLGVEVDTVAFSMAELEEMIGRFLPNSARSYREWWANTERSPQARGWLSAGWRVESVDRERELVYFSRNPEGYVPKVGRRPKPIVARANTSSALVQSRIASESSVFLDNLREESAFTYRWPKADESFDRCYLADLHIGASVHEFRHAIGERYLYGGFRVHSVTFLDGRPVVEGAGCDDYRISRSLVSFVRDSDSALLLNRDELPSSYKDFDVVFQSDELAFPEAKRVLAVKIRDDDVAHWALHAAIRRVLLADASVQKVTVRRPDLDVPLSEGRVVRSSGRRSSLSGRAKKLTTDILVKFQTEMVEQKGRSTIRLGSSLDSDQLLRSEPFALLVGMICDGSNGVLAGWDVPLELKRRLGHLDPSRIRSDYLSLRRAMVAPSPIMARVNDIAEAIAEAADRVVRVYGGDASKVWSNRPNQTQLSLRLQRFSGIGARKAQVGIEILTRFLGIEFSTTTDVEGGFDNQVRRVFARVGLSDSDQRDEVVDVARRLYPIHPMVLDQSAWEVGRLWCTPSEPNCLDCILSSTCLRVATLARS